MGGFKWQFKSPLTFNFLDPTPVTSGTSSTPGIASQHLADDPGDIRVEYDQAPTVGFGFRVFRFITLDVGSANLNSGDLCYIKDIAATIATTVMASAIGGGTGPSRNTVAGVALPINPSNLLIGAGGGSNVLTAGNQGWVQVVGFHPAVNVTGATVALGDILVGTATAKVAVNVASGTSWTYVALAIAVTVNTGNYCQARLTIPF